MIKDFTILHISDLHKTDEDSYKDLFESLRKDSEIYEKEGIKKPEIIVVSGDIVEGAKDDDENPDETIKKQYEEAKGFLELLCNYFLGCDKKRMIIVPGNHDMNRPFCKSVFSPSPKKRSDDYQNYRYGKGNLRWSWDDFKFFVITDRKKYENRFNHFVTFYNDFYEGKRTIKEDCTLHGNVIDLPEYNISFLALNSCHNLDRYNDVGSIFTGAVSDEGPRLSELDKKGRLLCAVWHHHISGLPTEHNYLDYRILSTLMRYNIQIGLFGHQHKTKVVQQYYDVTEEKEMLLICSGCLYGNIKQLAPNTSRQYNLISVRMNDRIADIEVRTRKDESEGQFQYPSWCHSTIGNSNRDSVKKTIHLSEPSESFIDAINQIDTVTRKSGNYIEGLSSLMQLGERDEIIDNFIDNYLEKIDAKYCRYVLDTIREPRTEKQAMYLLGSAKNLRDNILFNALRGYELIKNSSNPMIRILRDE